jgi:hypothetical protein
VSPALFAAAFALISGCSEPTALRSAVDPSARPAQDISDAVHNSGKKGFYFLPPMVAAPSTSGTFDPDLSPKVSICLWAGTSCGSTTAEFTTTTGAGGNVVVVDAAAQQYRVNWDTKSCATGPCQLDASKTYRLTVSVNGIALGHADLDVVASGSELRNVQTLEYVPLLDGRTLPIKFRVEKGVLGSIAVSPATASIKVGQVQQFSAVVRDLHGAPLDATGATWSSSAPSVSTVNGTGSATGVAVGSATISATVNGESATARLDVQSAGPTGTIVAMSNRFGGWRIIIMNADGTNARLVTSFEPQDDQPVPDLSPDLKSVVFASGGQVWKADVATGVVTQLTFQGGYTRYAKWSPDGTKIAFNSLRYNGHNLYIMNPDGTGEQQVTNDLYDEFEPTWSPDGKRLAFLDDRTGTSQLFVLDLATGAERQVTFDDGTHNSPRWSSTSSLVAYMKDNTIWVVDVDTGRQQQLTQGGFSETEPCFSPDGSQIIFHSSRADGRPQLWSVNPDGTNLHLFIPTPSPFSDTSPSWR